MNGARGGGGGDDASSTCSRWSGSAVAEVFLSALSRCLLSRCAKPGFINCLLFSKGVAVPPGTESDSLGCNTRVPMAIARIRLTGDTLGCMGIL